MVYRVPDASHREVVRCRAGTYDCRMAPDQQRIVTRCAASGERGEASGASMEKITKSVDLPDATGKVVILETGSKQDKNLVCLDLDGSRRRGAELPTTDPNDCFVAVRIENDLVVANSWRSCYVVWIDPMTGQTIRTQFTI